MFAYVRFSDEHGTSDFITLLVLLQPACFVDCCILPRHLITNYIWILQHLPSFIFSTWLHTCFCPPSPNLPWSLHRGAHVLSCFLGHTASSLLSLLRLVPPRFARKQHYAARSAPSCSLSPIFLCSFSVLSLIYKRAVLSPFILYEMAAALPRFNFLLFPRNCLLVCQGKLLPAPD